MEKAIKYAILDVQGYKGLNNKFIAKEIGFCFYSRKNLRCFLIKSPYEERLLNEKERKSVSWLKRNHHGIDWYSGEFSLHQATSFL